MQYHLHEDENILSIRMPVCFRRRSSRKMIIAPSGAGVLLNTGDLKSPKPDASFVAALVKAFQWQDLVDQGVYTSPKELAEKENIEVTHVYRLMRLTMLAPDIIEAVLDGAQPRTLTLQNIVRGFPVSWKEQRALYGFSEPQIKQK